MSGIIAQNVGRRSGLVKGPEAAGGEWTLIQTITSDGSDATISFTSGIDSTYDSYCFQFVNIHAETDDATLKFNGSDDGGSSYDIAKTTNFWDAYHREDGGAAAMGYRVAEDAAQGTGVATLWRNFGNDADAGSSGYLYLFNPSSTAFVKHFISVGVVASSGTYLVHNFMGGYLNTTAAITAMQFSMSADEIQGGSISLYGIG